MSFRSLLELNHDYPPDHETALEWAEAMLRYMGSGDRMQLPPGVKWLGMRHHSEPEWVIAQKEKT